MKKTSLICAIASIFICQIHSSNAALSIDACKLEGVETGDICWRGINGSGNVTTNITYATHCTSSSAGCVFINCTTDCTCNSPGFNCSGGGSTTDCSKVTCNPIWGTIDNTTHVQTGQAQEPDKSNNCECINSRFSATLYRCIAGYYDSRTGTVSIASKPTCEKCPSIGNNNVAGQSNTGYKESPSNKGITSCYIPYNTEITDNTGTYIFYNSGTGISVKPGCAWTE